LYILVTSKEEISEIEEALIQGKKQSPEIVHLTTVLYLLSDRKHPDYRNSIKESISSVEAICRKIGGNKATLGKALWIYQ
jgi:hypothetical protein